MYIIWKAPYFIVAEQEIPEKTVGKLEEKRKFPSSHSKEVHDENQIQKHTFVLPLLLPFPQLWILLTGCFHLEYLENPSKISRFPMLRDF
jgi:hypothetical protein